MSNKFKCEKCGSSFENPLRIYTSTGDISDMLSVGILGILSMVAFAYPFFSSSFFGPPKFIRDFPLGGEDGYLITCVVVFCISFVALLYLFHRSKNKLRKPVCPVCKSKKISEINQ